MPLVKPTDPAAREQFRIAHIFLASFLSEQRHGELLKKQALAAYTRTLNKPSRRTADLEDALWAGYHAVVHQAEKSAAELTKRGHLLFAFQGTKHPAVLA